jgi:hypothetical protein
MVREVYHVDDSCNGVGKRVNLMKRHTGSILELVLSVAVSGVALGQSNQQPRNVIVNGQSGKAEVIDQNGRLFVDISALASIAKGSVSFRGPDIVLGVPGLASGSAEPAAALPPSNSSALSQEFMKAGIEEIARLREWATTLGSAIRGGYGVTDEWVNSYRDQASQNLQLADVAASTDGDRNAALLLHHAFDLVQRWSDQLVTAKRSMDTAKYTNSPNALREDPLSQKILHCGHFLTQMLGSGTFRDDASCQ